jgi:divalent metal cation (Fe/Co/Zn/Cd) transporter
MLETIGTLFVSVFLFLLGYNFIFNTEKTLSKFTYHNNWSEEFNIIWAKIGGFFIIIFASIMLFLLIFR